MRYASVVFAHKVIVTEDALTVDLADGRTIVAPLAWFPRLSHGTAAERSQSRLIAGGQGIHWPRLDEDISIESLLAGRRSHETAESLRRWLAERPRRKQPASSRAKMAPRRARP
jgi:hypothetical protein